MQHHRAFSAHLRVALSSVSTGGYLTDERCSSAMWTNATHQAILLMGNFLLYVTPAPINGLFIAELEVIMQKLTMKKNDIALP